MTQKQTNIKCIAKKINATKLALFAAGLISASTGAVFAQTATINWQPIPGTETSGASWYIGTNTINRTGNAINFDVVATSHASAYVRYSANCATGYMVATHHGHLDANRNPVITARITTFTESSPNELMKYALKSACKLSN